MLYIFVMYIVLLYVYNMYVIYLQHVSVTIVCVMGELFVKVNFQI